MKQESRQVIGWQRLEGLFIMITAVVLYTNQTEVWWPLVAFVLAPDISMAGYLISKRIGAFVYNLGHTIALPLLLLLLAVPVDNIWLLYIATIWLAHIGIDRAMGFGLKYDEGFGHTHLGFIGRRKN